MRQALLCLALAMSPAFGGVGTTAIYTKFEHAPPGVVMESLQREVVSIMSTAGLHIEWRSLDQTSTPEVFSDLAVAKFNGRCDPGIMVTNLFERGALAWSHVSEGEVLPFTDVDCDRIVGFLGARMTSLSPAKREEAFGRAVGRVLAHELFHIFAQSTGHGTREVDQPYYTAAQLLDSEFGGERGGFHILRSSKAPNKPKPVSAQAGWKVFLARGCSACHGSQGEGTRHAPRVRVKGRLVDSVVLAARLERDAPEMYRRARGVKVPAPSVDEDDLADLVLFLNGLE
jgi:mono/diheme cytochrome c family protein